MSISLYTESRGRGPSLVLLHGWGLNSGVWELIGHQLADRFRLTLIDLPGYGRNANQLPDPYTLDALADLVGEHLQSNSTLLGWSLGGLIAQKIAISQHPNLSRLVLLASSPKFADDGAWKGIKQNVLRVFETQLEKDFSKTLSRFLAIQALGSDTAKQDIRQIKDQIQHFPIPDEFALQHSLSLLSSTDLRAELSRISVPTFRLYGRLDSLVPHQIIDQVEAIHSSEAVHIFHKASHAPFISHPEEFLDCLVKLLD